MLLLLWLFLLFFVIVAVVIVVVVIVFIIAIVVAVDVVLFIVEVVIVIIVISLTSSRTGRPVRKAQRWLPPCHQQRPNTKPRIQHIRHSHIKGWVRVQLGTFEKVCTPVSQNDVGQGSSPILTDNQALEIPG